VSTTSIFVCSIVGWYRWISTHSRSSGPHSRFEERLDHQIVRNEGCCRPLIFIQLSWKVAWKCQGRALRRIHGLQDFDASAVFPYAPRFRRPPFGDGSRSNASNAGALSIAMLQCASIFHADVPFLRDPVVDWR
jgi:hypothetical protein